jgi:hypothetical protein
LNPTKFKTRKAATPATPASTVTKIDERIVPSKTELPHVRYTTSYSSRRISLGGRTDEPPDRRATSSHPPTHITGYLLSADGAACHFDHQRGRAAAAHSGVQWWSWDQGSHRACGRRKNCRSTPVSRLPDRQSVHRRSLQSTDAGVSDLRVQLPRQPSPTRVRRPTFEPPSRVAETPQIACSTRDATGLEVGVSAEPIRKEASGRYLVVVDVAAPGERSAGS